VLDWPSLKFPYPSQRLFPKLFRLSPFGNPFLNDFCIFILKKLCVGGSHFFNDFPIAGGEHGSAKVGDNGVSFLEDGVAPDSNAGWSQFTLKLTLL
jgi:hypothetical protein